MCAIRANRPPPIARDRGRYPSPGGLQHPTALCQYPRKGFQQQGGVPNGLSSALEALQVETLQGVIEHERV